MPPASDRSEIDIATREQLIYTLTEAAELEHNLCCSYLFAAFSLKSQPDEGLDRQQLATVGTWREALYTIATQEMLHLVLTGNLLTAIGAAPHFRRPNFPQLGTHYPPEINLALTPFTAATLDHFVYVERPEDAHEDEGEGFESEEQPPEPVVETDIVPQPQDFVTVNQLYRGIQLGFRTMVDRLGEARVFIGPPAAQAGPPELEFEGLVAVTDLSSAIAAIELIIEQGEGSSAGHANSHYRRFLQIRRQYQQLKARHSDFEPARPVLENPFTRAPGDSRDVNLVGDAFAVEVCDLFNGTYELMLQLLLRYFAHVDETRKERKALLEAAIGSMTGVLRPLGEFITTLPAGDAFPDKRAGPGFHFYRSVHLLPHKRAAWMFLHERLVELEQHCGDMHQRTPAAPALASVHKQLRTLSKVIGRVAETLA